MTQTSSSMTLKDKLYAYMQLTRFDKPVGIELLLWPTLWGVMLAAMGQAQQEQSLVVQKLRVRETEKRRSDLTLSELKDVDNATKAYVQVGKMFLQEDLAGLKKKLSDKSEACGKEAATLKQQKEHVDEAAKKVIFLAIEDASKKWTMPIRNWKKAMNHFMIHFEEQLKDYV